MNDAVAILLRRFFEELALVPYWSDLRQGM